MTQVAHGPPALGARGGVGIEPWRRFALYLLLLGTAGVAVELVLLEHYADPWQWAPLTLLGLALVLGSALTVRPTAALVRSLQVLMALFVLASALGIYLHVRSNVEFELELRPSVAGRELIVETLKGAIPALAPGAMAQLGLLGLLACFRHPVAVAARTTSGAHDDRNTEERRS